MACDCEEDKGCECKMLRTIKAIAKKSVDNDLDIEKIMDMLEHYEMALSSQAIQIESLKEELSFIKVEHRLRRETIKNLEARIDDLEKDRGSKTSPSGNRYDNYFGDYSSGN